ncbi:MAG: hypothetical protein L3K26_15030, partial [Candidatus Hydrogenedentes bacterium]|nr:hypothetical protein [Candidatus Hydrogenedentota bacterium]
MKQVPFSELNFRPSGYLISYRTKFPWKYTVAMPAAVFIIMLQRSWGELSNLSPQEIAVILLVPLSLLIVILIAYHGFWRFTKDKMWVLCLNNNGLHINPRWFVASSAPQESTMSIHLLPSEVISVRKALGSGSLMATGRFS